MTEIPKAALRARQMYDDGKSVARILRLTRLGRAAFHLWLDGGPIGRDGARPLPALVRRSHRRDPNAPPAGSREALVARLWRAAERQVGHIERRFDVRP